MVFVYIYCFLDHRQSGCANGNSSDIHLHFQTHDRQVSMKLQGTNSPYGQAAVHVIHLTI